MGRSIRLDIPESIVHRAEEVAQQTDRSLEAVLVEWVERGAFNDGASIALLSREHHLYTPLGGEDTARALLEYLHSKEIGQ